MIHRTIRIAVTLCLIIATMIQPMSASGGTCADQESEQKLMCQGCGCCEVAQSSEKCSCCSHAASDSVPRCEAPQESGEPAIVSVSTEEKTAISDCTCGLTVPPMNRANPRDQLVRELTLRLAALEFVVLEDDNPLAAAPRAIDARSGSRADFSQRILCVWRI
ncbi:hypothetical protein Poly51_39480 [Rubripirellula tenax]|uniref:Secreted protein n=1 Tax=Rubripirellula tenax TaxID=2528015 RepID=A0A5C6EPW2_9BACT|nr:hypothetical protein [Rubripirellula tenax]TWU50655.1 hypothetical protein Poly51_39480 [Rubripirellula tenax]